MFRTKRLSNYLITILKQRSIQQRNNRKDKEETCTKKPVITQLKIPYEARNQITALTIREPKRNRA